MELSIDNIKGVLKELHDPHTGADLVSSKAINDISINKKAVKVEVLLGYPAKSYKQKLAE